jgi:hypothetical protein
MEWSWVSFFAGVYTISSAVTAAFMYRTSKNFEQIDKDKDNT